MKRRIYSGKVDGGGRRFLLLDEQKQERELGEKLPS